MLSPRQKFLFRGHPTSPGIRDFPGVSPLSNLPTTNANLSVLPQGSDEFTRDGKPGVPRYIAPYPRDYHVDPANLAVVSRGPKAPGIEYWGDQPRHDPWAATNARLRQAAIQAAQSGSA